MGLFYKAKSTEIDNLLIKIFEEKGIPALHQKGFVQSPFSTSWILLLLKPLNIKLPVFLHRYFITHTIANFYRIV